ncbi:hypothetical protein [Streptomyces natalensis]|uniref:Uncharacterized protein n=1 Tax=Streptomyces natalensis ATCC 27448 TaxID=1240678 RepID=A0A0D7CMN5_9ACTN|nr:hypothetical protein [Streptomyces natalensis]KIZ17321.1 hypothetical protein SNA_14975 [Streptomyces natalensis ATCC 27448]
MSQKQPGNEGLVTIPATEVSKQDLGTLSLEYRDGVPVLKLSEGTAAPAHLAVVDSSGNTVASYTATMAPKKRSDFDNYVALGDSFAAGPTIDINRA